MLINEKTKIAALLKAHPDALEAIVPLSEDFKKLRNPLLRKLMAGRTTIAMAAKIGGRTPEDFFAALAPLGFEVEDAAGTTSSAVDKGAALGTNKRPMPEYLKSLPSERLVDFDVRAMLATGTDPLKAIQQKVKELSPGEALLVINNFEPVPLIKLLEKQGFKTYTDFISEDTIKTYFYKEVAEGTALAPADLEEEDSASAADWTALLATYKDQLVEVDVRDLEMPMPMMTILEHLEQLPAVKALYVHHKRIPVFLLTELKDRAFDYRIKEVKDGEVYLLIFKS